MLKFGLVTLGCDKNTVDSERYLADLVAHGGEPVADLAEAEVVVVNTCGFIDAAKQESLEAILGAARLKDEGACRAVFAIGCMVERHKGELLEALPEVDVFLGTSETDRLVPELVARGLLGGALVEHPGVRLFGGDTPHVRYLKVSEGCDHGCAFCAIPLMRGRHVSTPMEQLVANAGNLARQGVKELILIAQDLTYYGLDIYRKRNIDELVARLSDVEGIDWIRLHYAFPSGFPMEVLDVMRDRSNVCNYLDMPLQHGSTRMLTRMRRGITQEKTEALVNTIRDRVPGIAIRTTLISGFPGESQADHDDNLRWIERMRFDRLGAFTYSHEEDTHAHSMADDVPPEVKEQRAQEIMELQAGISQELNQAKVGKVFRVLVDKAEAGHYIARTEFDSPEVDNEVLVPLDGTYLRIGDFAEVRITAAREHELVGEVVPAT